MYRPVAPDRGWVPAPRYLLRRARILALTEDLAPGPLLEIGCGAGALLHEFARRGFTCTALESSALARELTDMLAREAGLEFAVHAEPLPRFHQAFDTVCAFEVLEHVEEDAAALATWASWLRPGGRLVLSVPARQALWTVGDEWADISAGTSAGCSFSACAAPGSRSSGSSVTATRSPTSRKRSARAVTGRRCTRAAPRKWTAP